MGFSHYWANAGQASLSRRILPIIRHILRDYASVIMDVKVTPDEIIFNDATDRGSTFHWEARRTYSFPHCKTNRAPYDTAVCLVLLALKEYGYLSSLTSDGDAEEWAEANAKAAKYGITAQFVPPRRASSRTTSPTRRSHSGRTSPGRRGSVSGAAICCGIKRDGERCSIKAQSGSLYCGHHRPS